MSSHHSSGTQLTNLNFASGSSTGQQSSPVKCSNILFMKELVIWSKGIKCPTVLILDNAEHFIYTYYDKDRGGAGNASSALLKCIDEIVECANGKLDIIVTSQYELNPITTVPVRNLTLSPSVELIMNSTHKDIDQDDAKYIAELVGGCPLALKIIAGLLNVDDDVNLLKKDLKKDLIKPLNTADDETKRLEYVFNIAFGYLEKVDVQLSDCIYCASLFPGSFSDDAGNHILPEINFEYCHRILKKHSFLEKYNHGHRDDTRFEMHSLIRQYSRKRGHQQSNELHKRFNESFSSFFTTVAFNYIFLQKTDEHSFKFRLEHLNIEYLLQVLVSKDEHNIKELQVLAWATGSGRLAIEAIEVHYHEFVNKINAVCEVLSNSICSNVYSVIVQHTLDNKCYSSTLEHHLKSYLFPYSGMFDCETLREIRMRKGIWIFLKPHGHAQIYLRHLEMAYCKPLPILNFHFPWPVLFLIVSAEIAVMPTIVKNPPTLFKFIFMIASLLCVIDVIFLGYEMAKSYPDLDPAIASIAEIMIYLPSFVIFLPRICIPHSRMYRESSFVTKSSISNTLVIVLIFVLLHYAYTSFPNVLLLYEMYS